MIHFDIYISWTISAPWCLVRANRFRTMTVNTHWRISGSWARPYYRKTHPFEMYGLFSFFSKSGQAPNRFTGKLIQSSISEFRGMTLTISLENSSKYGNSHDRVFQWISPVHYPKIEISKLDEFSSCRGKLKFRKNLDEFSSSCQ